MFFEDGVCDGAWLGQKISAKQLKTSEGGDSSCANTLLKDCFLLTSANSAAYPEQTFMGGLSRPSVNGR